jgi:hypothetical protein
LGEIRRPHKEVTMKVIAILGFALLLFAAPLSAQHAYYPLHVGNIWQYFQLIVTPDHWLVDVQQTNVVGDTVMPNGQRYSVVSGWWWAGYTRQEGDSVLHWSPFGDVVLIDFSRAVGDTIISTRYFDTVFVVTVSRDTVPFFGSRRLRWLFKLDNPFFIDDESLVEVVDSIGLTYMYFYGGPYNFKGARIDGVIYGNLTSVEEPSSPIPTGFRLEQNYPNPFNPSTTIRYAVPHRSHVTLSVFNTLGQHVATLVNGEVEAGYHEVQFSAEGFASGVYLLRLQAGSYTETKELCLVR